MRLLSSEAKVIHLHVTKRLSRVNLRGLTGVLVAATFTGGSLSGLHFRVL